MEVDTIYLIEHTKFGKLIANWTENLNKELIYTSYKNDRSLETIDGLVLFHENHNFSKEDDELYASLKKDNKATHKVDLNGTLSATLSNFKMWLSLNKPKNLLFVGEDKIINNANLEAFLNGLNA